MEPRKREGESEKGMQKELLYEREREREREREERRIVAVGENLEKNVDREIERVI